MASARSPTRGSRARSNNVAPEDGARLVRLVIDFQDGLARAIRKTEASGILVDESYSAREDARPCGFVDRLGETDRRSKTSALLAWVRRQVEGPRRLVHLLRPAA